MPLFRFDLDSLLAQDALWVNRDREVLELDTEVSPEYARNILAYLSEQGVREAYRYPLGRKLEELATTKGDLFNQVRTLRQLVKELEVYVTWYINGTAASENYPARHLRDRLNYYLA